MSARGRFNDPEIVLVGEAGPEIPPCPDPVFNDAACPTCGWQHVDLGGSA